MQLRKTSPCWSPAVWCDAHGIRKPSICMLRCPCALDPPMVGCVPRCGPAGGSPGRRSEMQVMFAVRMRLGQSRSGPASTCIEDLRVRTSSVAARSTRPPRSYRVRHRIWELRLPPQERRELCQAPDTRMWLNARKLEDETLSVFAGKHTVGKVECLAFQRTNPRLLNPTTRPSGPPTWNSGR